MDHFDPEQPQDAIFNEASQPLTIDEQGPSNPRLVTNIDESLLNPDIVTDSEVSSETPIERLKREVDSMSRASLRSAVNDIFASLGDAVSRHNMASQSNNISTSSLREEMKNINDRLMDTSVEFNIEATKDLRLRFESHINGFVISCCFESCGFKATLFLAVPSAYPDESPEVWFDPGGAQEKYWFFREAREAFLWEVWYLTSPLSVSFLATTWDECARYSLNEYAQQQGGGDSSAATGTWETDMTE